VARQSSRTSGALDQNPAPTEVRLRNQGSLPAHLAEMLGGFNPSDAQRHARARMWSRFRDDPTFEPARLSALELARRLDIPSVEKWMADPAFSQWFFNRESWKEKAELAFDITMDRIIEKLHDPEISLKELTALKRELSVVLDRVPKKLKETKFLDADVNRMDRDQLEEVVKKSANLLPRE
jgi:hypothetical protein